MESWTSYMIEGTKIRLLNNTTKNIEDLTTNDELIVMNASDPSFDAANLQHNPREGGFATNVIKKEFSLSDVVTIQLENGSEVTVTKDNPIVGAHKSAERIRGITIFGNSGHNFTSGKITLFGVK